MPSFANTTTHEDTIGLNGDEVINFPWKVKRLTITNDSGTKDLRWKFKEENDWATLKPYETVAMELSISTLRISSTGAQYRVWGIG